MNIEKHITNEFPIVLIDTGYVNFYSLYATELWFKLACEGINEPEEDSDLMKLVDNIWVDVLWINYGPFGRFKRKDGFIIMVDKKKKNHWL